MRSRRKWPAEEAGEQDEDGREQPGQVEDDAAEPDRDHRQPHDFGGRGDEEEQHHPEEDPPDRAPGRVLQVRSAGEAPQARNEAVETGEQPPAQGPGQEGEGQAQKNQGEGPGDPGGGPREVLRQTPGEFPELGGQVSEIGHGIRSPSSDLRWRSGSRWLPVLHPAPARGAREPCPVNIRHPPVHPGRPAPGISIPGTVTDRLHRSFPGLPGAWRRRLRCAPRRRTGTGCRISGRRSAPRSWCAGSSRYGR